MPCSRRRMSSLSGTPRSGLGYAPCQSEVWNLQTEEVSWTQMRRHTLQN
jgi:hypothetical protein